MPDNTLTGITLVSFESRLAETTAQMAERFGAHVISAPSMQEVEREEHSDVFVFGDRLFKGEIDMLICLTGVGTRMLIETLESKYSREEIVAALSTIHVVARGPKPIRVLKENNIPISLKVPEPNTWIELLDELEKHEDDLTIEDRVVAIQEYGRPNEELVSELKKRGARVMTVPVYRWALPDDLEPLKEGIRSILEHRAQVAMFTSRSQIDHVIQVAEQEGIAEELKEAFKSVVVASVGPVCTEGLNSHGIEVHYEPKHPKLGALIQGIARDADRLLERVG